MVPGFGCLWGDSKPKTTKEIKGFKDPRMICFLFESLDSNYLNKIIPKPLSPRISVFVCDLCVFLLAVGWLCPVSNKTFSKLI